MMTNAVMKMNIVPIESATWTINIESPIIERIRSRAGLSKDEFSSVIMTAVDIISHCPNPQGYSQSVTGLALGKVQSGKTLSFTTLIALAIENGYRNIVVMAGTKNALLEQNFDRLQEDLGLKDPIENDKVRSFKNPDISRLSDVKSLHKLGMGALFVILKNKSRIDKLKELLNSPELNSNLPTLIIDDEGDEASLNTKVHKNGRSAIYASIERLRNVLPKHAYIAYTATPQANLLQHKISSLSPDFCSLVEPGDGYCGGTVYFGDSIGDFVRDVPKTEESLNSSGIPGSLRKALAIFLVGSAIRHISNSKSHNRMLVHSSRLTENHMTLTNAIKNLREVWRDTLSTSENDPSRQQLILIFSEAYEDLITTVSNPPSKSEVIEQIILREINAIDIVMINSKLEGSDPNNYTYVFENNILIGGDKLSRGVTIKDLLVTYMTRRPDTVTADTLEQRARWFGYRRKHLDFCRVFLTKKLKEDYTTLLAHEDDFWDSLRRSRRQNIPLKDWPRLFRFSSDETLTPTRKNVAYYSRFKLSGWEIQKKPILNIDKASSNINVIKRFFAKYPPQSKMFGSTEHGVLNLLPVDVLVNELLNNVSFDTTTDFNQTFVSEYLMRLFLGNKLQHMTVLFMSNGNPRKRTETIENTQRINPMQGPASNYPGDYELLDKPHLQVHLIDYEPRKGEETISTSVFALFLPESEKYDLSFIVGGDR